MSRYSDFYVESTIGFYVNKNLSIFTSGTLYTPPVRESIFFLTGFSSFSIIFGIHRK